MAYSRWLTSRWYTFWLITDGYHKDEQYFEICDVKVFSYPELKKDIEECLSIIRSLDSKATEKQIQELKGYMKAFIWDIEHDADIKWYKKIETGKFDLNQVIKWSEALYEEELREEVNEALKILCAEGKELPILFGSLKFPLGKILLEKRFSGAVAQLGSARPAVSRLTVQARPVPIDNMRT